MAASQAAPVGDQRPKDFEAEQFLTHVKDLSEKLQLLRLQWKNLQDVKIDSLLAGLSETTDGFLAFETFSGEQLVVIRERMKTLSDWMVERLVAEREKRRTSPEEESTEETTVTEDNSDDEESRALEERLAQLAKLSDGLQNVVDSEGNEALRESLEKLKGLELASRTAEEIEEERRLIAEAEKQKELEAQRKREEEERRRKEEEAKRRKEEEERKRREELEAKRLEEEQRIAYEKKSPFEKYPTITYDEEGSTACVVCGVNLQQGTLNFAVVDPMDAQHVCEDDEELVSSIIRISPEDQERGEQACPLYLAMQHCVTRAMRTAREPAVKIRKKGRWQGLSTQEVTLEAHKDMKFAQIELLEFGDVAVVAKYKSDHLHLSKRGGKATSLVDHRLTFSVQEGELGKVEHFTVKLQPIDAATIEEIKEFNPEARGLITASAIVNIDWKSKQLANYVLVTLPCHPNPVKAKKAHEHGAKGAKRTTPNVSRQQNTDTDAEAPSGGKNATSATKPWFMGKYGNIEDDENDSLWLASQQSNGRWLVLDNVTIDEPRIDLLQFHLHSRIKRFAVLRTRTSVESKEAQRIATIIDNHLKNRMVDVIVRQRLDDPCAVKVQLAPHGKSDTIVKELDEEGYNYGQTDTRIVHLHESQLLEVGFRGNLKVSKEEAKGLSLIYHAHATWSLKFSIIEADQYRQKHSNVYRGFIQLFNVPKKAKTEAQTNPNENKELLCETPVSIPKAVQSTRQLVKIPVTIGSRDDPITVQVLRDLAGQLGDEWQRVAHLLRLKKPRIQAIMVNDYMEDECDEETKYDMLITWAKTVPHCADKADILQSALRQAGRTDLARTIKALTQVAN